MTSFVALGDSFLDPNFTGNSPPTWGDQLTTTKAYTRINNSGGNIYRSAILGTMLECNLSTAPLLGQFAMMTTMYQRFLTFGSGLFVCVAFGVNDYYGACLYPAQITLSTWRQAWQAFWQQLSFAGTNPVKTIVLGLPYLTGQAYSPPFGGATHAESRRMMDDITNAELDRALGQYTSVSIGTPIFLNLDAMLASEIAADGVHPNAAGQTLIYNTVFPFAVP
jgi:hypothetical protein